MGVSGYRYLTETEEQIMEIFWASIEPVTSVEILKKTEDCSWNGNYLHRMLRSLLKKGLIEVCGTVQYGTQYARQFRPLLTKEAYAAQVVLAQGRGREFVAKVSVAMVQEVEDPEEVIEELENIIQQIRDRKGKKD